MAIIEIISNLARSLTLGLRLIANMTAGHVVLVLFRSRTVRLGVIRRLLFWGLGSFYLFFELAVCVVQTLVFIMLLVIYSNDYRLLPCSEHRLNKLVVLGTVDSFGML